VVTLGQPLGGDGDLGKAIENVAQRLCGALTGAIKTAAPARSMKPAYSQA
jgi:hypothetical protein